MRIAMALLQGGPCKRIQTVAARPRWHEPFSSISPGPHAGLRMAFAPRTLLFGATAAALHYNCFSRAVVVVFTNVAGPPLLRYFDDFGALGPSATLDAAFGHLCAFATSWVSP